MASPEDQRELRQRVLALDERLLEVLAERLDVSRQLRDAGGSETSDRDHLGALVDRAPESLTPEAIRSVMTQVVALGRAAEQPITVAYAGPEGGFCHWMARSHFASDAVLVGCPTVRAPDGLALSSRNAYLTPRQRGQAVALVTALREVAATWEGNATKARDVLRRRIGGAPGVRLDYAEVVHPETLDPLEGVVTGPAQALVAAFVGTTRLIDNYRLEPPRA